MIIRGHPPKPVRRSERRSPQPAYHPQRGAFQRKYGGWPPFGPRREKAEGDPRAERQRQHAGQGNEDNQAGAGIDTDAGWQAEVQAEEEPLARLFVTLLQRFGVETDTFGGLSGTLDRV